MTNNEFLNDFNFRFNNLFSNLSPGLDEYEISLLLTKAQDDIIKAYFNPKKNKLQEGYDMSSKRQIDFSTITKNVKKTIFDSTYNFIDTSFSTSVSLPTENIISILNETLYVTCKDNSTKILLVIPLSFLEMEALFSLPFYLPVKNKAWRIIPDNSGNVLLFYHTGETPKEYRVRYIKKPYPIILIPLLDTEDINSTLESDTIEGYTQPLELYLDNLKENDSTLKSTVDKTNYEVCELPEELHSEIIDRAVELAKVLFMGLPADQLTIGSLSSTDLGVNTNNNKQ